MQKIIWETLLKRGFEWIMENWKTILQTFLPVGFGAAISTWWDSLSKTLIGWIIFVLMLVIVILSYLNQRGRQENRKLRKMNEEKNTQSHEEIEVQYADCLWRTTVFYNSKCVTSSGVPDPFCMQCGTGVIYKSSDHYGTYLCPGCNKSIPSGYNSHNMTAAIKLIKKKFRDKHPKIIF